MTFVLSSGSMAKLQGVNPDLQRVVYRAITITPIDFGVSEGLRTLKRQGVLFNAGASTTMRSRHLSGHAVDLYAWLDGKVDWSWPLYHDIAGAMMDSAMVEEVELEWGGDWKRFPDGPHFQLPWKIK